MYSTAQANGSSSPSSPPTAMPEDRSRTGRTRFPPAIREYSIASRRGDGIRDASEARIPVRLPSTNPRRRAIVSAAVTLPSLRCHPPRPSPGSRPPVSAGGSRSSGRPRRGAFGPSRRGASLPRTGGSTPRGEAPPPRAAPRRLRVPSTPPRRKAPSLYPPSRTASKAYPFIIVHRSPARKGEQARGIDAPARNPHAEMQMRPRRPPRCADRPDPIPPEDLLPLSDGELLQVIVDAEDPAAVVDHHRSPAEELLGREGDPAVGDRPDRRSLRQADVHGGVRHPAIAVDHPARAEIRGAVLLHRRKERDPPARGGHLGEPPGELRRLRSDPDQRRVVEFHHPLRQGQFLDGELPRGARHLRLRTDPRPTEAPS